MGRRCQVPFILVMLCTITVQFTRAQISDFTISNYLGFTLNDGNSPDSRGPILFPQAPDSGDTSGVVIGASGYGFVPPNTNSIGIGFRPGGVRSRPRPNVGRFF